MGLQRQQQHNTTAAAPTARSSDPPDVFNLCSPLGSEKRVRTCLASLNEIYKSNVQALCPSEEDGADVEAKEVFVLDRRHALLNNTHTSPVKNKHLFRLSIKATRYVMVGLVDV